MFRPIRITTQNHFHQIIRTWIIKLNLQLCRQTDFSSRLPLTLPCQPGSFISTTNLFAAPSFQKFLRYLSKSVGTSTFYTITPSLNYSKQGFETGIILIPALRQQSYTETDLVPKYLNTETEINTGIFSVSYSIISD